MRADSAALAAKNRAAAKRPRYTIEVAFDPASSILWYFTSHTDSATPPGASMIANVVEAIAGTSQKLTPDEAVSTIGEISFNLADRGGVVTSTLGAQLALGRSTRRQRVRVYVGYEGLDWADYALVQTQIVTDIKYKEGAYAFRCMDVQREMRQDLFQHAKTTLAQSLSATDTTVTVYDTSAFSTVAHALSYSDAPNATVGYIKVQDEAIRYTGKTSTTFTGCTRGALNTRAIEHAVDPAATPDRRTTVEEYVFLEAPALKLMYALLTGRMPPMPLALAVNLAADDYTTWAAGVTPAGWTMNQDIAGEASFAVRAGPNGDNEVVMCCKSLDTPAGDPGADGGWTMPNSIAVDKTKPYLFTCFFKRLSTGTLTGSNAYWGLHSNSATPDVKTLGGVTDNNPYFVADATAAFMPTSDVWYLAVGFVHENGYGTTDTLLSGVYDLNGVKVHTGSEFKWQADTTLVGHRAYHYYNTTISGEVQQMARPRVWQCSVANAPALIAAICNNASRLPTNWNLGIDPAYVQAADYTGKRDLYDPLDDRAGFVVRFEDLDKGDGKKFIEQELALLCGAFMPVYASGALGLRRMSNVLAGASYVQELNESNVVGVGELLHDFESLHNNLQVSWNWEPLAQDFTRLNLLLDANSITVHGRADPLKLAFRGLHGSRHSSAMLAQRFDAFRDRYTGPPLRLSLDLVPSCNSLEIGDVVRVRLSSVRDIVSNGSLDRSFEVQNVRIDWVSGKVSVDLFASSQGPGALAPSSDANVLTAGWYTSQGTNLATVLTITGSNPGHVSANGTIAGGADMNAAGSIFYYNGDLQIDSGVTVNITGNVQPRINGFFQNNGSINGKGGGLAGAAAPAVSNQNSANAGITGGVGSTEAGGGLYVVFPFSGRVINSTRGIVVPGANPTVPSFNLGWDGTTLSGLPNDLRGSSGSSGMPVYEDPSTGLTESAPGGNGGASGAGLCIVCRGFAQGVAAKIDLSGTDGTKGSTFLSSTGDTYSSGSGAGGAPGGLLVLIDGAGLSATGLTEAGFVALSGKTPLMQVPLADNPHQVLPFENKLYASMFVGTGDGTTFPLPNLSGARGGARVQYVPNNSGTAIQADPSQAILTAPTNIGLASGTTELLTQSDGTVIVRIKVTWTPSVDARVAGYDIQFKKSTDSIWISAPSVAGQSSNTGWVAGIQDGVNYDVRVRGGDSLRDVSDWVTVTGYGVIGKTAKPTNVGTLSYTDPVLIWSAIADDDRLGYIVRYQPGTSTDWTSALPAHQDEYVTPTRFDTSFLVGGQVTLLVKAVDTTRNQSTTAASITVDLRPSTPNSFLISRQPDGTREFTWTHTSPPSDLAGWRIRYFLGSTADWNAMTAMHNGLLTASPFETNQLAAGTYTFAIKAVDGAGNESANALFITSVTVGDPRVAGSLEDIKEEPTWTGTKTDCHVDAATGWLVADGNSLTWTGLPATWTLWTAWNYNPKSPILYVRQIDVGIKTKFTPLVTVTGDGTQLIEEQHSDDNVTYSAYTAVGPQVDARYIRIRVTMTLVSGYPKLKTMRTILSANPIEETIQDLATASLAGSYRIGTGDIRLPITKTYSLIKTVQVTLQNVGGGWSWELIDKNTSVGPRIKIYNAANALADATIDADIVGV